MAGQPGTTVPVAFTAVQWSGDNLAEVQELIGAPNASVINGGLTLLVNEFGRDQRGMQPGGWVVLSADNHICCVSEESFARYYRIGVSASAWMTRQQLYDAVPDFIEKYCPKNETAAGGGPATPGRGEAMAAIAAFITEVVPGAGGAENAQ